MRHKRFIIRFGTSVHIFYTDYHTAQFCRALRLNNTSYTVEVV